MQKWQDMKQSRSQEKIISDNLKNYSQIAQRIRTRKNLSQVNQIMFFDYPASEIIMKQILLKTDKIINQRVLFFI